jgi:hypothetical protein
MPGLIVNGTARAAGPHARLSAEPRRGLPGRMICIA